MDTPGNYRGTGILPVAATLQDHGASSWAGCPCHNSFKLVDISVKLDTLKLPSKNVVQLSEEVKENILCTRLLKRLVVHHIYLFPTDYKTKQQICEALISRLSLEERVKWVVERFQKNKASRPKRKNSLLTTVHSFCRKELSDEEVQQIVTTMIARKLLDLTPQGGVVYQI